MGKQHFGCKIKMSVGVGRPAQLLRQDCHDGKSLITESAYIFDSCSNLESPADFTAVAGCL